MSRFLIVFVVSIACFWALVAAVVAVTWAFLFISRLVPEWVTVFTGISLFVGFLVTLFVATDD